MAPSFGSPGVRTGKRTHQDAFDSGAERNPALPSKKRRPIHPVSQRLKKQTQSYSIQLSTVTIKKKKETYEECWNTTPPQGYAYLPVGFRLIKEACRNACLKANRIFYVVSVFPQANADKLPKDTITRNIYRFGWHFPNDVLHTVSANFGLRSVTDVNRFRNPLSAVSEPNTEYQTDSNITDVLLDLFPNIPNDDLQHVLRHAFQRGSNRIGDASDISFPRRAQLAVVSHIRHELTEYDAMLKSKMRRNEARLRIEPICLRLLLKWRGEDNEVELQERVEEVIVIEDSDEESHDELDFYQRNVSTTKRHMPARQRFSPPHHHLTSTQRTHQQQPHHSTSLELVSWRHKGKDIEIRSHDLPATFYNPQFPLRDQRQLNHPPPAYSAPHRYHPYDMSENKEAARSAPEAHAETDQRQYAQQHPEDREQRRRDSVGRYHPIRYQSEEEREAERAGLNRRSGASTQAPSATGGSLQNDPPSIVYDTHGNRLYLHRQRRVTSPETVLPSIEHPVSPAATSAPIPIPMPAARVGGNYLPPQSNPGPARIPGMTPWYLPPTNFGGRDEEAEYRRLRRLHGHQDEEDEEKQTYRSWGPRRA